MALKVYPLITGVNFESTTTTAVFALGEKCEDSGGGSWVYVQANGAITQYDAVKIDHDFQIVPITTAISGSEPTDVGLAQVAFADNEYGWVFEGPGGGTGIGIKVRVLASCATDVKLYTNASTAGTLDDTAADLVQGLMITATNGGSTAAVECYATCKMVTNAQD